MTLERFTAWPRRIGALPAGRYLASLFLLLQVWVTWVFFRAGTLEQATRILGSMFSFGGGFSQLVADIGGVKILNICLIIGIAAFREFWFFMGLDQRQFLKGGTRSYVEVFTMALLIVVTIYFRGPGSQFIYFQF